MYSDVHHVIPPPPTLPPPLSAEGSSSGSSSDEEVREAFENYLPPVLPTLSVGSALWSPAERPIRVAPSGCRKRVPKYFAQMASTDTIERPRLDFNKMQSRRLTMVREELASSSGQGCVHLCLLCPM